MPIFLPAALNNTYLLSFPCLNAVLCKQLNIIPVKSLIISASGTAPCSYNNVLTLYGLIIVTTKDLSDPSAKCMSYDTVSYLLAYTYAESVGICTVVSYKYNKNTVCFALHGVVYLPIFAIFLN